MEPKEFIPLGNQNCRLYDQDLPSNLELKKKLESSCSKVNFLAREDNFVVVVITYYTREREKGKKEKNLVNFVEFNLNFVSASRLVPFLWSYSSFHS